MNHLKRFAVFAATLLSAAVLWPGPIAAAAGPGPLVSEMIIGSNRDGGRGQIDLWVSTRATTLDLWSTPVNLGKTVNGEADDSGPALSANGTALYFYSTRTGGFGGRDLYVSTRTRLVGEHAS